MYIGYVILIKKELLILYTMYYRKRAKDYFAACLMHRSAFPCQTSLWLAEFKTSGNPLNAINSLRTFICIRIWPKEYYPWWEKLLYLYICYLFYFNSLKGHLNLWFSIKYLPGEIPCLACNEIAVLWSGVVTGAAIEGDKWGWDVTLLAVVVIAAAVVIAQIFKGDVLLKLGCSLLHVLSASPLHTFPEKLINYKSLVKVLNFIKIYNYYYYDK